MFLSLLKVLLFGLIFTRATAQRKFTDNIDGTFQVAEGRHYSNKSTLTWGQNGERSWSVSASFSHSCAVYNSTDSCSDPQWMYDWNKLWGKARCGYLHDHHKDSDRFVWRRCSDPSCARYEDGKEKIELAAYSYDNGIAPYTGENPNLLKEFSTTIYPDKQYELTMTMDETGLTVFGLNDPDLSIQLEMQSVQHDNLCSDNFYEGTVDGLYFGGTCTAPNNVIVSYISNIS